jgi:hypothetical protein
MPVGASGLSGDRRLPTPTTRKQWNLRALVASPIVILIFMGTRLLIVSNYDTNTAVTILNQGGIWATFAGSALPMLPLLLPTIAVSLLIVRAYYASTIAFISSLLVAHTNKVTSGEQLVDDIEARLHLIEDSVIHIYRLDLLDTITQHKMLTLAVGIAAIFAFLGYEINIVSGTLSQETGARPVDRLMKAGFVGTTVALGWAIASVIVPVPPNDNGIWLRALHQMWYAPEKITFTNGSAITAYHIGLKNEWTILLTEHDRSIIFTKAEEIQQRQVCSMNEDTSGNPVWRAPDADAPEYPACPDEIPPDR